MLALTRRVSFNAGHVYRGGGLSDEELQRTFGPAAYPSGHGHDYVLEVTVAGSVGPKDGMVVNIKEVDAILKELIRPIDHRMVNDALPEFADAVPTTERLAQVLWTRFPKTVGQARAVRLRLQEHPGLYVDLEGKDPEMIYLTSSVEFASSHRLHSDCLSDDENRKVYDKCNNPHGHGHNYVAEVTVKGVPDKRTGIIVDLGKLDALLAEDVADRFDHKHLNLDTSFFDDQVASAENIARVIWGILEPKVPGCREGGKVELHRVRLIETARSWFDYFGETPLDGDPVR